MKSHRLPHSISRHTRISALSVTLETQMARRVQSRRRSRGNYDHIASVATVVIPSHRMHQAPALKVPHTYLQACVGCVCCQTCGPKACNCKAYRFICVQAYKFAIKIHTHTHTHLYEVNEKSSENLPECVSQAQLARCCCSLFGHILVHVPVINGTKAYQGLYYSQFCSLFFF